MKQILIALALLMMMPLSAKSPKSKKITVDKQYSLQIPDFLTDVSNPAQGMRCMYQNGLMGIAIQVIDEKKEDLKETKDANGDSSDISDIANYYKIMMPYYVNQFEEIFSLEFKDKIIHGKPAKEIIINGYMNQMPICYKATFVEAENYIYQIIAISKMEDEEKFEEMMTEIINSFQEI